MLNLRKNIESLHLINIKLK